MARGSDFESGGRGIDHGEAGETALEEPAVARQEAVGSELGVGADQEVGHQVLAAPSRAPVGSPEIASELRAGLVERIEHDPRGAEMLADALRVPQRGPDLAPDHRAGDQRAARVRRYERRERAVAMLRILE